MRRPQTPVSQEIYEIIMSYATVKGQTFASLCLLSIEERMLRSKVGDLHDKLIEAGIAVAIRDARASRSTAQGSTTRDQGKDGKLDLGEPNGAATA